MSYRIFWLILLLPVTAVADEGALTLEQAIDQALNETPQIAASSAMLEAAQAVAPSAGRLPDPELVTGVDNLPMNTDDRFSLTRDFMTMRKIGVMQEVPNAGKRRAQTEIANAAISKTEAERHVRVLEVRRDTALAWINRFYVERQGNLLDALYRENGLLADAIQAQLAANRATPADAVGPKQEAAELADRRDVLASEIAKSKSELKRWVGDAGAEPLAGEPPSISIDQEHLRAHVHEHPELAVFAPLTEMARAELHEAEAEKRPDWGLELTYGKRGSLYSDMVSVQFTVGLPISSRNRQDPQIDAKREMLKRVDAERTAMFRDHTRELEGMLADYDALTRQLERMNSTRIPLAEQKADYRFASYRSGKSDLNSVLDARRELIDLKFKQLELEREHMKIAAKLYFIYAEGAQ